MQNIRRSLLYQQQLESYTDNIVDWNQLKNKTILITGATGMLGVFLIDLLMYRNKEFQDGIRIIAISRDEHKAKERLDIHWDKPEFFYLKHNIDQPITPDICPAKVDYIIHGASNTHPVLYATDPIGTIEANVTGTMNLLELASAQTSCRVVFLSSVEIYGENRGDTEEFEENYCGYIDCNTLRACYTEGKRLGEALCQAYISTKKADAVIPRLCRVYGPTMLLTDTKAISQLIQRAVAGEDIILKSDGMQLYSYIYVADAVSAILTIMLKGKTGEAYNVAGRNSNWTLRELAEYLASLNGKKVTYAFPDEKESRGYSAATKALMNADKLKAIGWDSRYAMRDGIKLTYEILRYKA